MSESFNWNKVLNNDEATPEAPPKLDPTQLTVESNPSVTVVPMTDGANAIKLVIEEAEPVLEGDPPAKLPTDGLPTPDNTPLPPAPKHQFEVMESGGNSKLSEEAVKIAETYKPAFIPESVHSIKVNETKFEVTGESELGATVVSQDVVDVAGLHIDDILKTAIERKASDIHLTTNLPPMARVDGELTPLPYSVLTAQENQRLIYDTLTDEQLTKFEETHELDFSYGVKGVSRFRFNVYMQRGAIAGALRAIPTKIPSFDQLGLPGVIRELTKRTSGLVLVTGPTGSGKSTTIASMIDDINESRTSHVMTIEDPIEYLHNHKKCMVNQREMHSDTYSFHNALRAVLREDPDIILVGELRDLETIEAALTLAETGHLVFGTLHTRNAPSTIDRIIDVFPSDQQSQIRVLLGNTLEAVISQQLLPRLGGGRIAAIEIMVGTSAIKNLIREGKTHQMYSVIETNAQLGMQTMDRSLCTIFREGSASYDECAMRAVDKENFARLAKGA